MDQSPCHTNTFKCPKCKAILAVTGPVTSPERVVTASHGGLSRLEKWLNTPITVYDLLTDYGCEGNLLRFAPLDREVVRTAFRSMDAISALELGVPPEKFHYTAARLPGWSNTTTAMRVFGVLGRWWVKSGHEPGFIDPEDDLI